MNLEGKITHVLELQEGVSKAGNAWAKREIVVEELNPRNADYPQSIKVEQFKTEDNIKWIKEDWKHKVGDTVELVDLSFKTSEWKGKYYTNISVYKIEQLNGVPVPVSNAESENNNEDDLPF